MKTQSSWTPYAVTLYLVIGVPAAVLAGVYVAASDEPPRDCAGLVCMSQREGVQLLGMFALRWLLLAVVISCMTIEAMRSASRRRQRRRPGPGGV